ncbi:MAG: alpha/beta hydrolase, partial [Blastocatellia bacterium]
MIAGSGPTNRDGNSPALPGQNNSLRYLAEGLAARGIASLRYDKRGVAESVRAATKEDDLRFETFIDDAVLWAAKLKGDRRFSALIIAGHSEGSLIGMAAAQKAGADALVSIAGAGRPAQLLLAEQLGKQLPPDLLRQT